LKQGFSGDIARMGLLRWLRGRRRDREAEKRAMAEMRRVEDADVHEPAEVKLSQMRD
jgi:hypothetical protein